MRLKCPLRRGHHLCLALIRHRLREDQGVVLVTTLGVMLVLTIAMTTVVLTAVAGAQDAQRTNAGQEAYAIAEAGINNALAILDANYPGPSGSTYPDGGETSGSISSNGFLPFPDSTSPQGSLEWTGKLVEAPPGAGWGYQWNLSATADVSNPTGPAAEGAGDVTRTVTAVVPVVMPQTSKSDESDSAINYIYGGNISFDQSVVVKAPVYATGDLSLVNTAAIAEDIPASQTAPAGRNTVDVGGNLSLVSPQNQIGHVDSSTGALAHVEVGGTCTSKFGGTPHSPCTTSDYVWATTIGTTPTSVQAPTMTCCSPAANDPALVPSSGSADPSAMGEWYLGADLGPSSGCDPSRSSGAYSSIVFDNDKVMNQSAYSTSSPFNLVGSTYSCVSSDGRGELSWDGSTLVIKGTVFIDGSACICSTGAGGQYVGNGTIILTGIFTMNNNDNLCVKGGVSGASCNQAVTWNPNSTSLGIIAYGDNGSGQGIVIDKGAYQGLLMARKSIDCSVAGTMVQGPVVSTDGDVSCGQAGSMYFPAIKYPTAGEQGFFGPNPQPVLLPPVDFGGG